MSPWIDALVMAVCLLASAAYAGSETAFYSVSRARVDVEARQGRRSSRMVRWLLEHDTAFLISILIGNALMIELMTWRAAEILSARGLPPWGVRVVLTVVLTPIVFFFAEVMPKDLFRRRPYASLSLTAGFLILSRWIFWPLERLLSSLVWVLTRLLGFERRMLSVVAGREAVLALLSEGAREGAILPHAEQMARNVLKLRSIDVARCMVPWKSVEVLRATGPDAELYAAVGRSPHTRLPVVDAAGHVLGYVHQLDVLGEGPDMPVLEHLRPLIVLSADTPVDRALARLRSGGHRLAVVGALEEPVGILTLKDLLEEISGDLAGW